MSQNPNLFSLDELSKDFPGEKKKKKKMMKKMSTLFKTNC
jgi:hypothetical protein